MYQEILKRLKDNGHDLNSKNILAVRNGAILNGQHISGYAISKDKRWVCVPVFDETSVNYSDSYEFRPQCYEILEILEMYTKNGFMLTLTTVFILA